VRAHELGAGLVERVVEEDAALPGAVLLGEQVGPDQALAEGAERAGDVAGDRSDERTVERLFVHVGV